MHERIKQVVEFVHLLFHDSLINSKIADMLKSMQETNCLSLFPPDIISSLNRIVIGYDKGSIMVKVLGSHIGVPWASGLRRKRKRNVDLYN